MLLSKLQIISIVFVEEPVLNNRKKTSQSDVIPFNASVSSTFHVFIFFLHTSHLIVKGGFEACPEGVKAMLKKVFDLTHKVHCSNLFAKRFENYSPEKRYLREKLARDDQSIFSLDDCKIGKCCREMIVLNSCRRTNGIFCNIVMVSSVLLARKLCF